MTDVHTTEQRSYNMSRIRSKWTKQEKLFHNWLKGKKIKHKMHPEIEGRPDILIKDLNVLIFLDGCFWHKCPQCFQEPEANKKFWLTKIEKNVKKDGEVTNKLKKEGWKVMRIWEHEVKKDLQGCLKSIESAVDKYYRIKK